MKYQWGRFFLQTQVVDKQLNGVMVTRWVNIKDAAIKPKRSSKYVERPFPCSRGLNVLESGVLVLRSQLSADCCVFDAEN
jgi:hypothetical protein